MNKYLEDLDRRHLRRHLRALETSKGEVITLKGRPVVLFASNNYLGLATHPAVKEAGIKAMDRWGVGAGASRLVSGTTNPHQELEKSLASFKGTEAALSFGSGYLTNIGLIPQLVGAGDLILADRLCHASLIDGCRLAHADLRIFAHNDVDHLRTLLERRKARRKTLIVTEGVFSMDGDLAPLPELAQLARSYETLLLVDDAHGTGVMGAHGRGTLEHFGLEPEAGIQMGTLSKAIGSSGGYVVGSCSFIQYLINTARSFIYTTALPPALAEAAKTALSIIQSDQDRRQRLWENRRYVHAELLSMGFQLPNTQTPILPLLIKDPQKALEMSDRLLEADIYVPAIRPPTVPKGSSRLRLTVSSEHTTDQLTKAVMAFRQVGEALKII